MTHHGLNSNLHSESLVSVVVTCIVAGPGIYMEQLYMEQLGQLLDLAILRIPLLLPKCQTTGTGFTSLRSPTMEF